MHTIKLITMMPKNKNTASNMDDTKDLKPTLNYFLCWLETIYTDKMNLGPFKSCNGGKVKIGEIQAHSNAIDIKVSSSKSESISIRSRSPSAISSEPFGTILDPC